MLTGYVAITSPDDGGLTAERRLFLTRKCRDRIDSSNSGEEGAYGGVCGVRGG